MSEDIEKVAVDETVIDSIAERVASLLTSKAETPAEDPTVKALRDELAEIKAGLKPQRTDMGDGGVPAAKGDDRPVITGGDDKYTSIGSGDADVAVNLFLAGKVLGASGKSLSPRAKQVMLGAAESAVKAGPRVADIETKADALAPFVRQNHLFIKSQYAQNFADVRKAMTSTGANQGDEWVPTFATSELWRDVHLATAVAASVPRVDMPTNPFDLPTLDSDVTFYYASTENTAVTGSQPNTGKATLTAKKIQADVTFSGEVEEDSIIAIAPTVRANLVRRGAQVIDDLIVHGDTETGATGNVNTDNGAPSAGSFFLALDGLRKFAIVTNTGQTSAVSAALTTANFTTIRGLLGKYGGRPSDLRIVVGQSTLNTMYDISQVKTVDVYGPQATILQGELARFFGIPILLSEATPVTDSDLVAADGKSDSTAGTKGWLLLFNVNGWKTGFRREFNIEADRNIQTDSNILVASFRMALIPSGISVKHTAVGRDITV